MTRILNRKKILARLLEIGEIPFGKYRGELISDVAAKDPRYLRWLRDGTDYGTENRELIQAALQQADLAQIEAAPEIHLTAHQQECADKVLTAVADGAPIVRLEGGAGYGKSYATKEIANRLRRKGIAVQAMAVSYVATQVLAEQLDPYGVESATVARALKFDVSYENGEQIYHHSPDTAIVAQALLSPGNALIVDECSMINDRDANLLLEYAYNCGGHLILVGDSHQLPPVKQEHLSQCCGPLSEDRVAELTVPMRYSRDSHLFQIEQGARNKPYELLFGNHSALLAPSDQLSLVQNMDQMMARYTRYFKEDPKAQHRMLLFRRRDVTDANNRIRQNLFGADADIVEEDEQLMILRTGDTPAESDKSVRYYSGQTYRVLEKQRAKYTIDIAGASYTIPHWIVQLDDKRPPVRIIFGITENQMDPMKLGGPEFQTALQAAREQGLEDEDWTAYKILLGDFVRVAYQYATSIHRAQGQTVDYAYCHPASLLSVRGIMGKALAYVAMTRAKKHLTVL